MTADQEYKIKETELALRRTELDSQNKQRKTTAGVTVIAALVALVGSLGAQLVAQSSQDKPVPQKEALSLHFGSPLHSNQNAGVYLFDAKTGNTWVAIKDSADKPSWVFVNAPSVQVQKTIEQGAAGDVPKVPHP